MADPTDFLEAWAEIRAVHTELSNVLTAAEAASGWWKRFLLRQKGDTPRSSQIAEEIQRGNRPRAMAEQVQSVKRSKPFRAPASIAIH
jgi:hypothetical protein